MFLQGIAPKRLYNLFLSNRRRENLRLLQRESDDRHGPTLVSAAKCSDSFSQSNYAQTQIDDAKIRQKVLAAEYEPANPK